MERPSLPDRYRSYTAFQPMPRRWRRTLPLVQFIGLAFGAAGGASN